MASPNISHLLYPMFAGAGYKIFPLGAGYTAMPHHQQRHHVSHHASYDGF
jgi:hypothetical protein